MTKLDSVQLWGLDIKIAMCVFLAVKVKKNVLRAENCAKAAKEHVVWLLSLRDKVLY